MACNQWQHLFWSTIDQNTGRRGSHGRGKLGSHGEEEAGETAVDSEKRTARAWT